MPNAQNNPAINARRFAALLAGFDTGNGSEEEALAKGRALRRMAADVGLRVVDVMELPEVKQAIDDQMRPARTESPALQEALHRALALQDELTERTRDVRQLAELLSQQEERAEELSRELTVSRSTRATRTLAQAGSVPAVPAPAIQFPGVEPGMVMLTALLALVLLVVAIVGGHFHEGGNDSGLGYGQGISASGVHEGGAVRAVPEHGAVHHRLHRGGTSSRTR
jgi:hypothetical protein